MPAVPPAVNFEYELIFLASPWPSRFASARLAASYDPNLMAVSGMILITFNPFPGPVSLQVQGAIIEIDHVAHLQRNFGYRHSETDLGWHR